MVEGISPYKTSYINCRAEVDLRFINKMAEAAVESPPCSSRFYCHQCSAEVTPNLPDLTCPRCNSGFIEEVPVSDATSSSFSPPPNPMGQDPFAEILRQAFLGLSSPYEVDIAGRPGQGPSTTTEIRPGPSGTQRTVRVVRQAQNPILEGLLQYVLTRRQPGSEQGAPIGMFQLHGNPADYAWGVGGLDSIITQLLNQLESCGPPPAEREKIESLPTVFITSEQVAQVLQCSICMDDFVEDESVKRLPCEHHYHEACIVRWLEMHGTCPVCRKDLSGHDTSDDALLSPLDGIPESSANNPTFDPSLD